MPFTAGALARVHHHSRGTPRLINTICDNALFEGFVARAKDLDERAVDRVARDLGVVPADAVPAPAAPGRPDRARLDLADIDRYLESLGK
jgi:hypothetical protein